MHKKSTHRSRAACVSECAQSVSDEKAAAQIQATAQMTTSFSRIGIMLMLQVILATVFFTNAFAQLPNVYVLNPGDGAINQKASLDIKSKLVPGASIYEIQVSPVSDFSSGVISHTGDYIQHFILSYATTYYARVRSNVDPRFGRVTTFKTMGADVYLTYPADNATHSKLTGNFQVKAVSGATLYTLELSKNFDFAGPLIVITSSTTLLRREGLEYSTKYYARARTDLEPVYGKTTSFTTRAAEEDSYVVSPSNGSTGTEAINAVVTANAVVGATTYQIELSTTSDFSGPVLIRNTVNGVRSATFERLAYLTTYYARVKTNVSSYGVTTSFKTRAEEIVYVLVPEEPSTGYDPKIMTLTVDQMRGASSYTLQLSKSPDFSSIVPIRKLSPDQFSFVLRNLDYGSTYYARAKSNISTKYGPVISFTTREPIAERRLWGLTSRGGNWNRGTLFSYSIDSAKFTKHEDFPVEPSLFGSLIQTPGGLRGQIGNQFFQFNYDGEYHASDPKYVSGDIMLATNNFVYVNTRDTDTKKAMIYRTFAEDLNASPQTVYTYPTRGWEPFFRLQEGTDGYLYGATYVRGLFYAGTIYRMKADGMTYETLHDFNTADGWGPRGVIIGNDGYLYGGTASGGLNNRGVIFKCKLDGSSFTILHHFNDPTGVNFDAKLSKIGNVLYGMTFGGGTSGAGVIFRINTDGSGYEVIKNFELATGGYPNGSLTVGENGIFYGMTHHGGLYGGGVLFSIKTDGTDYKVLVDLSASTGYAPYGDVLFLEDVLQPTTPAAAKLTTDMVIDYWPNPFESSFNIQSRADDEKTISVAIKDMQGNVLSRSRVNSHDISSFGNELRQGMYILEVTKDDQTSLFRIIKK